MNTPAADFFLHLEEDLEGDVRECLRLLDLGLRDALEELHRSRAGVSTSLTQARQHLEETAKESRQQVEAVQQCLGRLGMALHQFVLTDPLEIENLEAFDTWRDEVLQAFERAREALDQLQGEEDRAWKAGMTHAWRRFRQQLEAVRVRLDLDRMQAQQELAAERKRLRERLSRLEGEIRNDPASARETIQQMAGTRQTDPETSRLEGWLKALLMWKDYPRKGPPPEPDRQKGGGPG